MVVTDSQAFLKVAADTPRDVPLMIATLHEARHRQLIDMYLAYQPRNSFSGLPPIKDAACVRWVEKMIATGINLVALSLDTRGSSDTWPCFPSTRRRARCSPSSPRPARIAGSAPTLVRCAIPLSRQLGLGTIRLVVDTSNYVAGHVYEKCGFRYLGDDRPDELDMALDLEHYESAADASV